MASGRYEVRLDLRPVLTLRPHEETIESNTRQMVEQLLKDGVQKDPVIVDGASGVVLDGMHRLAAFRELGIGFAACSPVEYAGESVSLGRWLRIYRLPNSGEAEGMAEGLGLTRELDVKKALSLLDRSEVQAGAFIGGVSHLPPEPGDTRGGFAILRSADAFARSHGWARTFAGEEEVGSRARSRSEVVLLIRRFEKAEVLDAGITGRLLPCKTSMHLVQPRPVAVNVPLDELRDGSQETLTRRVREDKFKELPPNSVYEGRRYKERLLLLSGE